MNLQACMQREDGTVSLWRRVSTTKDDMVVVDFHMSL